MAFADGNIIIGTSVDVGGINTGLKNIEKRFSRIGKLAAMTLGIKAIANLGKAALNAASDLQEVQNVVDVSFGEMSYKIEAFSETCIEKFGMSRLAAKQTAGSFMAMGKSMGLSMEEASDMAVSLTGLTGDFASFHNISQEYARVAMAAVYTGETETLKRYGIVLTEANLQQFALSQGITDNVKKMDARDKAILRYQYIMQATQDVAGDFVRTQDSWANSTRVLAELWKEFLITLGSGLISVLTPLVQVLGAVVSRLTQFVQVLWQILSNIFGFKLQDITSEAGKMKDNFGGAADAAEDLGDEVAKSGKKAKKALAPFDDLNNIITTTANSASGAGGAGLGLGDIDLGLDPKEALPDKEDWLSEIDTLWELGRYIGAKLSEILVGIDWDAIFEKARYFGVGLAQFLNGLISTDLFWQVGRTLANSLNAVIQAALYFALDFDWKQFGQKLAFGVNSFFETFDFGALADTIDAWVQGIWDAILAFVSNLHYDHIFDSIKEFFEKLDPETVMILAGFFILKKLFSKALLGSLVAGFKEGLGLVPLSEIFSNFGKKVGEAITTKLFPNAVGGIAGIVGGIIAIIGGLWLGIKTFIDMWNDGFSLAKEAILAISGALVGLGLVLLGIASWPAIIVGAVVAALVGLIALIKEHWTQIVEFFKATWEGIKEVFSAAWAAIINSAKAKLDSLITLFKSIFQVVLSVIQGAINLIVTVFQSLWNNVTSIFNAIKTTIISVINAIKTGSTAPLQNMVSAWLNVFTTVKNGIINIMNSIWSGIKGVINSILGGIQSMANNVVSGINTVIRALNGIPMINLNIPTVGSIRIPRLAKGAVIPPNNEFLAVLGDQTKGTNIEAPLDTIKQAFMETLAQANIGGGSGDNGDIVVQIDGREVFRAVRNANDTFKKSTGISALA